MLWTSCVPAGMTAPPGGRRAPAQLGLGVSWWAASCGLAVSVAPRVAQAQHTRRLSTPRGLKPGGGPSRGPAAAKAPLPGTPFERALSVSAHSRQGAARSGALPVGVVVAGAGGCGEGEESGEDAGDEVVGDRARVGDVPGDYPGSDAGPDADRGRDEAHGPPGKEWRPVSTHTSSVNRANCLSRAGAWQQGAGHDTTP